MIRPRPRSGLRGPHLALLLITGVGSTALAPAQINGATLVADINPVPLGPDPDSLPRDFIDVGGEVFFVANRVDVGFELFKTSRLQGTASLVADLLAGPPSSSPRNLTVLGNLLLFVADYYNSTAITGAAELLSRSDGTENGTRPVASWLWVPFGEIVRLGNEVLFAGFDFRRYPWHYELYASDGTAAGSRLVKDIYPGRSSYPSFLFRFGNLILFAATDAAGNGLWRSDATQTGTTRIMSFASPPRVLAAVDNRAFFAARGVQPGAQLALWMTDGTAAGTVEVAGPFARIPRARDKSAVLGNLFVFTADDGVTGQELWKSDGTALGTVLLADIAPGAAASFPAALVVAGGKLFFDADDQVNGRELWKTTGSAAATVRVAPGSGMTACSTSTALGSLLYFAGDAASTGCELWVSDGTAAGTTPVADLNPGPGSSTPQELVAIGSDLFFSADPGEGGREPFTSDGSGPGTVRLQNIGVRNSGSNPSDLVDFYGVTLFAADDGRNGRELWRSDGSAGGTSMIADLAPGAASGNPVGLTVAADTVFFTANDKLWRTNGTAAGTTLVKAVQPIAGVGYGTLGRTLFFAADDGVNGQELWKSDGTAAGTVMVLDITPGREGTTMRILSSVGSTAFFRVDLSVSRSELWGTDGTPGGTKPLGLTVAWSPNTEYQGLLFFTGVDAEGGAELWRSDGTPTGTVRAVNVYPGAGSSFPDHLTVVGDTLFFSAFGLGVGEELWKSNGTQAGTAVVADLTPGPNGSSPQKLVKSGDMVLFELSSVFLRYTDLWRSDGTVAGTFLLRAFYEQLDRPITVGSRQAYYAGDFTPPGSNFSSHKGKELWRMSTVAAPTATTTLLVADIAAGTNTSTPRGITLSGGRLLFSADDNYRGRELWMFDPGATAQPVGIGCASPGVVPRLDSDDPVLGATAVVRGTGAMPGTAGALLLSVPRAPLSLAPGCFLYLDTTSLAILTPVVAGGSSWSVPVPVPATPTLLRLRVGLQAALGPTAASLGADLTNALFWTIGR